LCSALCEKYERYDDIGEGNFGAVCKARNLKTDQIVAIKRLKLDDHCLSDGVPPHVIREVCLLRDFVHPNVVRLLDLHVEDMMVFNLVFECAEHDLYREIRDARKARQKLPLEKVKRYTADLMAGIHACHVRCITHRDLKPQNVLVSEGRLKICDFGLARIFSPPPGGGRRQYTPDIITLWYRAPEILLGSPSYGPEVDVWSAGCIIGEMAIGLPIFPGDSEIDTYFKICRLMGTPTPETWPELHNLQWRKEYPSWPGTGLEPLLEARPDLGEDGIDLLCGLLELFPPRRTPMRLARQHRFVCPVVATNGVACKAAALRARPTQPVLAA